MDAAHLVIFVFVVHHDTVLVEAAVHHFLRMHLVEYFGKLDDYIASKTDLDRAAQEVLRNDATELFFAFLLKDHSDACFIFDHVHQFYKAI